MRSMSLVVIRRALALALAGGSLIAAAAHAQAPDPYADSYRAYDQHYGRYGQPPSDAYDDQDAAPYGGGYGQHGYGQGQYGQGGYGQGGYGQPGYAPQGRGQYGGPYGSAYGSNAYGRGYGPGSPQADDDDNPDSYGQPGYAPPANASPTYHRDAGSPGYAAPYGDDDDEGPPPAAAYGGRGYTAPAYRGQGYTASPYGDGGSGGGYPLPPN